MIDIILGAIFKKTFSIYMYIEVLKCSNDKIWGSTDL